MARLMETSQTCDYLSILWWQEVDEGLAGEEYKLL